MAKILVLDDDPEIRRLIVEVLSGAGHEIHEAKDGQEGLSLFRIHGPTLVITDILMPGKDGFEVIRKLRGDASRVAIIAISGAGTTDSMNFLDIAKKLGADVAIAKPFRIPDLEAVVDKLLKS
jgi:CheY-like chemotaxis protein